MRMNMKKNLDMNYMVWEKMMVIFNIDLQNNQKSPEMAMKATNKIMRRKIKRALTKAVSFPRMINLNTRREGEKNLMKTLSNEISNDCRNLLKK